MPVFFEEELELPTSGRAEIPKANHKGVHVTYAGNDEEFVENIVHAIEDAQIDITGEYMEWVSLGFSLCNLGESGRQYFHRISQFHLGYDFAECDAKYTELLARNDGRTSLGTLVF